MFTANVQGMSCRQPADPRVCSSKGTALIEAAVQGSVSPGSLLRRHMHPAAQRHRKLHQPSRGISCRASRDTGPHGLDGFLNLCVDILNEEGHDHNSMTSMRVDSLGIQVSQRAPIGWRNRRERPSGYEDLPLLLAKDPLSRFKVKGTGSNVTVMLDGLDLWSNSDLHHQLLQATAQFLSSRPDQEAGMTELASHLWRNHKALLKAVQQRLDTNKMSPIFTRKPASKSFKVWNPDDELMVRLLPGSPYDIMCNPTSMLDTTISSFCDDESAVIMPISHSPEPPLSRRLFAAVMDSEADELPFPGIALASDSTADTTATTGSIQVLPGPFGQQSRNYELSFDVNRIPQYRQLPLRPASAANNATATAVAASQDSSAVAERLAANDSSLVVPTSAGNADDAVASIISLLPTSLQEHLLPYQSAAVNPSLVEIVMDEGRDVSLRLSDRTQRVLLGVKVPAIDALYHLLKACGLLPEAALAMPWRQYTSSVALEASSPRPKSSFPLASAPTTRPASWFELISRFLKPTQQSASSSESSNMGVRPVRFDFTRPMDGAQQQRSLLMPVRQQMGQSTGAVQPPSAWVTLPDPFRPAPDNRMGLPGTLHRISCLRDREGGISGLTMRIGRHVPGVAGAFMDLLAQVAGHPSAPKVPGCPNASSLLLLGKPGVGKTTLLRGIARILADDFGKSVVIVDTSNEIAGDAPEAHPCIGSARRVMVQQRDKQADALLEAVQNHNPDVIIVDELSNEQEVAAARTISQRGVALVATAHGFDLRTLMKNNVLNAVLGGIKGVTIGDALALSSNAGRKTRLERGGAPTFSTLIEVLDMHRWRVHPDLAESVDLLLHGSLNPELASPTSNKPHSHIRTLHPCGSHNASAGGLHGTVTVAVQFETNEAARRSVSAAKAAADAHGGWSDGEGYV